MIDKNLPYWELKNPKLDDKKKDDIIYECYRCKKIINPNEELVFEFTTPNYVAIWYDGYEPTERQFLCPKCHARAIKPVKFKKLKLFFGAILIGIIMLFRPQIRV